MISLGARVAVRVQHTLGHLFFPLIGWSMVLALRLHGYRIRDMRAVRREFQQIRKQHDGALLLCANHLTMVDSILIDWALASNWTYLSKFRLLPWNIPERNNYYENVGLRILCYLCKCIAIERKGSAEHKATVFAQLEYLLRRGHSVCVFPEGTRSRTGHLDMENFGYGVGTLANRVENVTLVCIYLRGQQQTGSSPKPARGDQLYVQLQSFVPETSSKGLRAARDITKQVMARLQSMEDRYFSHQGNAA